MGVRTGSLLKNEVFTLVAGTIPFLVFFSSFFYVKWYSVIILVIISWLLTGITVRVFKSWSLLFSLFTYLIAFFLF
jgi:hypothetical protein